MGRLRFGGSVIALTVFFDVLFVLRINSDDAISLFVSHPSDSGVWDESNKRLSFVTLLERQSNLTFVFVGCGYFSCPRITDVTHRIEPGPGSPFLSYGNSRQEKGNQSYAEQLHRRCQAALFESKYSLINSSMSPLSTESTSPFSSFVRASLTK